MENRKLKVIAKMETDARNIFFVRMLYGYMQGKREGRPEAVYTIEDGRMLDTLIDLSHKALVGFPCGEYYGSAIIVYDPEKEECSSGSFDEYRSPNKIIVGTHPTDNFRDIKYLIRMISYTVTKNNMGEFFVQYQNKKMSEQEFYEFQKLHLQ